MNVRAGRSLRSPGGAYNAVLRPCAACSHCIKTMAGTIQTRWMVPIFPLSLHKGRSQVDKSLRISISSGYTRQALNPCHIFSRLQL